MDQLEKDIALLERYIEKDISEEDNNIVSERMQNDSQFKELHQVLNQLITGIHQAGRKKMLSHLQNIDSQLPEIQTEDTIPLYNEKRNQPLFRWIGIAASIILIVAVTFLFFLPQTQDMDALYAAHFETYPNLVESATRGESSTANQRQNAFRAYEIGNFEQAVTLFESIPVEEREQANYLYMGIAYLMINDGNKAVEALEKASQMEGGFEDQVQWYLGLSYLKTDQKAKARQVFDAISNSEYSKNQEAKAILDQLEK